MPCSLPQAQESGTSDGSAVTRQNPRVGRGTGVASGVAWRVRQRCIRVVSGSRVLCNRVVVTRVIVGRNIVVSTVVVGRNVVVSNVIVPDVIVGWRIVVPGKGVIVRHHVVIARVVVGGKNVVVSRTRDIPEVGSFRGAVIPALPPTCATREQPEHDD